MLSVIITIKGLLVIAKAMYLLATGSEWHNLLIDAFKYSLEKKRGIPDRHISVCVTLDAFHNWILSY